jgi:enoyl-CoA hydratase/carnithine racemase
VTPQVLYEVHGRVARLTINRPEQRNALSNEVLRRLRAGVQQAAVDPSVRVLVLAGSGDRTFCAGGDLTAMRGEDDPLASHFGRGDLAALFQDMWGLGKPTIARVHGHALAGGLGLAMACDFVVASDTAVFGLPEVDVGLWAFMVTIPLLHVVSPRVALDLLLTGRRLNAHEAARLGLVRTVVPAEQLDRAVDELAGELAAKSPMAVKLGRDAFYAICDGQRDLALRYLNSMLTVALSSNDAVEGLAAFHERRVPSWRD